MTKEKVYDDQIEPLMRQILAICKEHKIAMLADFTLDDDMKCTSALLSDEYRPTPNQLKCLEMLRPSRSGHFSVTEMIETKPDGSKVITISGGLGSRL